MEPTEKFVAPDEDAQSDSNANGEESMAVEYDCLSGKVRGEDDVGRGVARIMFGKSVFRGSVTKVNLCMFSCQKYSDHFISLTKCFQQRLQYKDTDEHPNESPSGTFFVKFTNGTMLKMDASQAKNARVLFEKEAKKLVEVGVPQADATSLGRETVTSLTKKHVVRDPILDEGEDEDPYNYEQIFEEVFQGEMPENIVGLQFDSRNAYFKNELLPLWEKVLMWVMCQKKHLVTCRCLFAFDC